jgi:polysaccharide biosynthesis/export protein
LKKRGAAGGWETNAMSKAVFGIAFLGCVVFANPARLLAQEQVVANASTSSLAAPVAVENTDSHGPVLQQRNPRYRVQPDDTISIEFPLSPEFDQPTVTIQPDGYINVQTAGSLYIQGLTVPEIVEALKKAYATTLHDPIINVDLIDFQRPYFLVNGQVGKPGQYDLRHDTTVSEAIAIAGGFGSGAKTQVFLYHRVSTDWVEVKKLSLKDLLNGKNANEDAHLSSGDMIFVPEKAITKFRKYVPYTIGTGFYPSSPLP